MEPSLLHKRGCVQRTQFSRVGPGHQPTVPLLCNWLPRPHSQAVESRVHISFENLCWTSTGCGCKFVEKHLSWLYHSLYRQIQCRCKHTLLQKYKWNTRWVLTKNVISSHVKITPLPWLHNDSRLLQRKWNSLVFHWYLYNKWNVT